MESKIEIKPRQRLVIFWAVVAGIMFAAVAHPLSGIANNPNFVGFELHEVHIALRVFVVALLVYAALWRARAEYSLEGSEVVSRTGVLMRRQVRIPLSQVQNVEITRSAGQLLLGLADVEIDSSGFFLPDLVLRHLSSGDATFFYDRIRHEAASMSL